MDDVTICNVALAYLGEPKIDSLSQESRTARLCNLFFPIARDAVIRSHVWNSAKANSTSLASLVTNPSFDWGYAYQLPADCLRVLSLENEDAFFEVSGRQVWCDTSPAKIRYLKRIEDPNDYDALLVECIALWLARRLNQAITRNKELGDQLLTEYETRTLPLARTVDSQENHEDQDKGDTWLDARG